MENKRLNNLSAAALIAALLPLASFIPILFNMTLTDNIRFIWAGVNILSVLLGLVLSIICVKNRSSQSIINIISTAVSCFFLILMSGIAALAVLLNFLK